MLIELIGFSMERKILFSLQDSGAGRSPLITTLTSSISVSEDSDHTCEIVYANIDVSERHIPTRVHSFS